MRMAQRRTVWLLPYTFLTTGIEPVCSTLGIAMLRLGDNICMKQLITEIEMRTDPDAHRNKAVKPQS